MAITNYPEMPDYGNLTAHRIIEDYCEEALVDGMMDLLADIGRDAVTWVSHNWGAGTLQGNDTEDDSAAQPYSVCLYDTQDRVIWSHTETAKYRYDGASYALGRGL
ncbi:hypothetical protein VM1G_11915 [Cytospora mali]|uniref:Uncharacterized protein n=1 Tax=Cytospora mali TaxID=578113 RepID=A0A194WAG2_CYTMA|nr:hypothetical protein VM1G_11915 [Valsa mali]